MNMVARLCISQLIQWKAVMMSLSEFHDFFTPFFLFAGLKQSFQYD